MKSNDQGVRSVPLFHEELGSFGFVKEVGIEHIELIALNNFGWGVVLIVVSLIVLIPLKTSEDTVEKLGFSRLELIFPFLLRM